jgi:diguanylate cyclase (GGDEF)-like protein
MADHGANGQSFENAGEETSSWLCRNSMDRERMLDMDRRLQPVRRAALGVLAIALAFSGPWLGWWTLAPLVFAAGLFVMADHLIDRVRRPEYLIFGAWVGSVATIAVATGIAGGPTVVTMSWLAIPIVTLSARFDTRGIAAGVVASILLLVATGLITDPGAVSEHPPLLIGPAAMVIAVAMLSTALMRSDVEHRSEALVDPLTGMLTRHALEDRVEELAYQSRLRRSPIGVIVGDLDCLKQINDAQGHAGGDEALKASAQAIRSRLRAFDLAYRIGGDEFLILLPGADLEQSRQMAESLREAIAVRSRGNSSLSMSFGVHASQEGQEFVFEQVFAQADAALMAAKRAGRDRVLRLVATG